MDDEVAVAATTRVAQVFDLHALKAFAPDKRVRKMLFTTEQLWSEIACYEPGQSPVMHTHPREEEAISVLEGPVNMNVAGEGVVVLGGSVVGDGAGGATGGHAGDGKDRRGDGHDSLSWSHRLVHARARDAPAARPRGHGRDATAPRGRAPRRARDVHQRPPAQLADQQHS